MIPASLKLAQMGMDKTSEVQVFKFKYSAWKVMAEGSHDGTAFKVTGEGDSLDTATNECHNRWLRITGLMPELIGALPPPDPSSYQDADHMITPQVDDDIPF